MNPHLGHGVINIYIQTLTFQLHKRNPNNSGLIPYFHILELMTNFHFVRNNL